MNISTHSKSYPVFINGKTITNIILPLSLKASEVEKLTRENKDVQDNLANKKVKHFIFRKNKLINFIVEI